MVIFSFKTHESVQLLRFIYDTNVRLQDKSLLTNPFNGKIHTIVPNTYIVNIEPVYPKFYQFGFVLLIPTLFFSRAWYWYIPSIAIICTYFLWSKYFYYIFLILGSRKAGHKNKFKLLTGRETVLRLLDKIL